MERFYIAILNSISRIGSKTAKQLIEIFGSAENVWRADLSQLKDAKLNQKIIENITDFRNKYPDAVEKLVDFCRAKKINICTFYDEDYPPILKEISTAPVVFYYRGELKPNAERIGIVGARDNTDYGAYFADKLGEDFAQAGITVVSGAAKGIDTIAHQAALKYGRTVAVLGYGMNKIPADKKTLFEEIVERGGVVMSEFPPNYSGTKNTFPARDRIIAGLVRGIVVVEAGEKSGALIAANCAIDNARDVFAIPHNIFSEKGVGCNNLIRDGATLITCAADVLERRL